MGHGRGMHVPRFIILSFIGLLLASILTATALLASGSEPELGDSIVVTPLPVPGPALNPSSTRLPKTTALKTVEPGAVPVPPCVVVAGSDDDCADDDVDDLDKQDELDDPDDDFADYDSSNNRYRYGYKQHYDQR